MNEINKTLYISLYGKAKVSKMGIILNDKTAETIWDENAVSLGRKSKSKWLFLPGSNNVDELMKQETA